MNKINKSATDDDEVTVEYLQPYRRSMSLTNLSIAIDEGIREPKYYRAVAEEITNLGEHDTVQLRINSPGGRLDGLVVLLNAIGNTEADVVAYLDGECHSAASILALHCPNVIISPYASMLVHNASYGTAGKSSDVVNMVLHNTSYFESLVKDTYQYFLTDKEIDDVLNGREIWLHAKEIAQRFERRQELLMEESAKAADVPALEEPVVKPKRAKKTPKEPSVS